MEKETAEEITGAKPPRSFILDASAMEYENEHRIVREDVKMNNIVFGFPAGVNKLDLLEECRALTQLTDFDMMFDITMQMLVDKDLEICMRNQSGGLVHITTIHVTNRYQDLRGDNFIDEYPVVVTWLVEFIGTMLLKKYPVPGKYHSAPAQVPPSKGVKKGVYQR